MLFETHAHLSDAKFDSDRHAVIERAYSNGLSAIIEIADGPEEWAKAQALAETYPGKMWWAAGLHPYYADQASDKVWNNLKNLSKYAQFVAIGEIGLDYAKCPIPHDVQQQSFRSAMDLAGAVNKPVIIHCREAYQDLMPILREYYPSSPAACPGVVHCFSGNAENAEELTKMGFYLGVDGPITYPNAKSLREALAKIPAESLVLETDSPYLPPQTHRGQRNEPSYISQVAHHLAAHLKIGEANLAEITHQNSCRLFRLNPTE